MMFSKEIEYGGFPDHLSRTITQKRRDADLYAGIGVKGRTSKKGVDKETVVTVESLQSPITAAEQPDIEPAASRRRIMTLTFKALSKNGKNAYYTGAGNILRFPLTAFPNKVQPPTIDVADGAFAPPKEPRAPMTPEERKAARAARPKLTLAEKAAKAQARLDKLNAALAAANAPAADAQM